MNLHNSGERKELEKEILKQVDKHCVETMTDDLRTHLGASSIGHECSRYLYLSFRWFFDPNFDGRQLRLFNRGDREEAVFRNWLTNIGFEIQDKKEPYLLYHPESDSYMTAKTEEELFLYQERASLEGADLLVVNSEEMHRLQAEIEGIELTPQTIKFSACLGHFGGSCDGQGNFPKFLNINAKLGFEFKTSGTGAGFNNTRSKGVALEKEMHYAQMQTYGKYFNWEYCLYGMVNKNDDDMFFEIIPMNHNIGEEMLAKAERIIFATKAPEKLSPNPTFYKCKMCSAKEVCQNNAKPLVNCRTCVHSKPVEQAGWYCAVNSPGNGNIPKHIQKVGCPDYKAIELIEVGLL